MRPIHAFLLLVLGGTTLAVAIHVQPQTETARAETGQPVFPGLAATLPQAARVEISQQGKTATLVRLGNDAASGWGVAERGSYPADPEQLRALFAGLAELRLIEPRTADPNLFGRLGVAEPGGPGDSGARLRVLAADNRVLADLVLGHSSVHPQAGMADELYLRRAGEGRAWLAEGKLEASADPLTWLDRRLLDIKAARIAHVDIGRNGETLSLHRDGDRLVLDNPPPGTLDDIKPAEVAQALEGLTFEDVQTGDLPGRPVGSAQYATADGERIGVLLSRDGDTVWARLAVSDADPRTGRLLAGHVYALPAWRLDAIAPKAADFIKQDQKK
jgi:hypothetical protein